MPPDPDQGRSKKHSAHTRRAADPIATTSAHGSSSSSSTFANKLDLVSKVFMSPFQHRKNQSTKIFSDLAPAIMTPQMINSAATVSARTRRSHAAIEGRGGGSDGGHGMDFATLGRAPLRLHMGTRRITSRDLEIVEATEELLDADVPEPQGVASNVSLLRGFKATVPSALQGKERRRRVRNVDVPKVGLRKLGLGQRGMLGEAYADNAADVSVEGDEGRSVASEDDVVVVGRLDAKKGKGKRRARDGLSAAKTLGKEELTRQTKEIKRDKENIHVRRSLINNEIAEITHKIEALDSIRVKLEQDLLKLQEEELELDDELMGVKERIQFEESNRPTKASSQPIHLPPSSRRRKGPAFLPSEHDDLPPGVAFMTFEAHTSPITALDFSEPYGTLVSASVEETQPRVWDLFSGMEIGRLRGHAGTVKCLQVEDHVCLTGGDDGNVRLWDLRRVEQSGDWEGEGELVGLSDVAEEGESADNDRDPEIDVPTGIRSGNAKQSAGREDPCARLLEGHTKAVTALYFEDDCLVTGASDKTLRQWDLSTGQCVMTMDILWAISHASVAVPGRPLPGALFTGAAAAAGSFAVPTPPYADGSWEMYQDFVGGVQFWGYGLVSGSGDGAVRMWDMRTGQAHRTLLGHTAPVTCLQFDEIHIVSGSLDKSIRVWDVRTGGTFETLKYDHGVTTLQFDTRKIVAATGENGIKIYNRTSMQHSTLLTNGHTRPVERLRYMDRYLVSGGRDNALKIWSL